MCTEWVEIQLKINKVLPEASIANSVKAKYKYWVVFFVNSCKTGKIIWWMTGLFINHMHLLLSGLYIILLYRCSVLFDIKYQCSATTHSHNPATTDSQTFLNLKNMHKICIRFTDTRGESNSAHTHVNRKFIGLKTDIWMLSSETTTEQWKQ